jgi:tetratricopeptide (TPR) repeat protein
MTASEIEQRAQLLISARRWQDVIDLVAPQFAASPTVRLCGLLAQAFLFTEQPDRAHQAALQALDADPQNDWVYRILGDCLSALGRAEEALEAFRIATTLAPESALTWCELASEYTRWNRVPESLEAIRRALALDPDIERCQLVATYVYANAGDWDASEAAAQALLRLDSSNHVALERLGVVARGRDNRTDLAAGLFRQALMLRPDSPMYLDHYIAALLDLGKPEEALAIAQEITQTTGGNAAAWCHVARAQARARRFDEALEAADRAVVCDPSSSTAHRLRSAALWDLGRMAEAMAAIREATRHATKTTGNQLPWVIRARFAASAGLPAEADESIAQARAVHPTSALVERYAASVALAREDVELATAAAGRAHEFAPGSADAWLASGFAAVAANDWPTARDAFSRASALDGDCCTAMGKLLCDLHLDGNAEPVQARRQHVLQRPNDCRCHLRAAVAALQLGEPHAPEGKLTR